MRNTWLAEQLQSISEEPNSFIIEETIKYIEQLEDDNESLQVALEGTIGVLKNGTNHWKNNLNRRKEPETLTFLALFFCYLQIIGVHLNLLLILQNLVYLIKRTCCVCKLQHLVGQMD